MHLLKKLASELPELVFRNVWTADENRSGNYRRMGEKKGEGRVFGDLFMKANDKATVQPLPNFRARCSGDKQNRFPVVNQGNGRKTMFRRRWFIGLFIQLLVFQCAGIAFGEEDAAFSPTEERTVFSPFEKVEDWSVTAGASADFYSAYVWRGQVLVDDPVFEPSAYVGIEKFTASVWGNYSFDDDEWTELDYTLDYTTGLDVLFPNLDKVNLSVGYIYYDFPNLPAGDDSQELYAKAGVDTFLSPSAAVYWDFDQGDGEYFEVAVEHSVPIQKASLNLYASVGYNAGQWGYASSWSAALFGASLSVPVGERIVVKPGVFYSLALDNQYDDEFYGGVSVSFLIWE